MGKEHHPATVEKGKRDFLLLHMDQVRGVHEAQIKLSSQHSIKSFLTLKISTTIIDAVN